MGMIMWELTTGCRPFSNVKHDHGLVYQILDGKRPKITDETPEDFANLIKKCWNSDPKKRPSAKKICECLNSWSNMDKDINQFNQAEEIRLELTKSKSIGPEFNGTTHSEAIYTSRSLGSFISKFLTPLKQGNYNIAFIKWSKINRIITKVTLANIKY
ncbi:hypothetical protein GLOIN_2v1745849 [Rhizophagus irregularis DAOM 181602=DAOM 197198]|uniref:Protein kinase domain-containing protein n=1 Tax=Rhizophagus irregularis (strain DAOM 181602 / DAOM 197198 / MUCL 43194) TaxID=747089 RepID=A0A2P4QQI7_RHIID|nr:hypothetical protein GLOIN_2v1745849 [Rhizophagus irregularis DAOM 181602=DAOM 197198]POG79906.1 hypothetical protein GLOIN_2v1745849 [Rhizophagus irregularis DAOM 181602=DAOM 197198]|eukprot:XP_025186772.1 hypothetical protein GLOIN_2v1745849 [Rhizophagus irregularis DAOM 181602=DAOM 197198]